LKEAADQAENVYGSSGVEEVLMQLTLSYFPYMVILIAAVSVAFFITAFKGVWVSA
jgi:hypothetical protein